MLRIAVIKGRIEKNFYELMKKADFNVKTIEKKNRELLIRPNDDIEIIFVKSNDVLKFIEKGIVDIGIVGKDTLEESDFMDYDELLDLNIGKCYFALASFEEYKKKELKRKKKIATKYPNITKNYFKSIGEDVEVIKLEGSVELAPVIGIADGIVDIVETGDTLKANGLVVIDKICDISTRMIANKVSLQYKSSEIYKLVDKFEIAIGGQIC